MKKRLTILQGPMSGMTVDVDEAEAENMLDTGWAEEAPPEPVVVEEKPEPEPKPVVEKKAEPKAEKKAPAKKAPAKKAATKPRKRVKRKMETPEG